MSTGQILLAERLPKLVAAGAYRWLLLDDAIGAWPEKGLLSAQPGPTWNGRQW